MYAAPTPRCTAPGCVPHLPGATLSEHVLALLRVDSDSYSFAKQAIDKMLGALHEAVIAAGSATPKQLSGPWEAMDQVPPASMQLVCTLHVSFFRYWRPAESCETPRPSDVQTPKVVVAMDMESIKSPVRPSAWSPSSA